MASPQIALAEKPVYSPPPIDGDFYTIANVLDESGRALIKRVRAFTEGVVAPIVEEYWARDEFPFEIIPRMAEVGIAGVGYEGYGAAGGSWLLNGFVAMELRGSIRRLRLSGACIPDFRRGRSTCAVTTSRDSVGCPP